jgi:two-component system, LytTR family, response regulator
MNRISAIIMDDEKPACNRLFKILSRFPQIDVKRSFTKSREGIDYIVKTRPKVVFLDIEMEKNITAFDIISELMEYCCSPVIILITAYPQYTLKALESEVFDYLMKPVDIDEMKDTINRLEKYLSSSAAAVDQVLVLLSKREKEIFRLLLDGLTSQEIAGCLRISKNTVNTHRRNILEKTGARTTLDLLRTNKIR